MIRVSGISTWIAGRRVLDGVSFVTNRGERTGVAGPNGSGKTTLLRIIAGDLLPDAGAVEVATGARLAFLRQGYEAGRGASVAGLFPGLFAAGSHGAEAELTSLAERLARERDPTAVARLESEYEAALDRLNAGGPRGALERWQSELGLRPVAAGEPASALSGGELTKLGLLELLAAGPDALLLDEPTNFLDLHGIAWLEEYLDRFEGPVVIVSHDRALLDGVDRIVELDRREGSRVFTGNYSDYASRKAGEQAEQWGQYRRQQADKRRLKREISKVESMGRTLERRFIRAASKRPAEKLARRAVTLKARLQRQLDSAAHVDRPDKPPVGLHAALQRGERGASRVLSARSVDIEAGGRRLLEGVQLDIDRGERVFVLGPNGSGKTTLLRAIAGIQPVAAGELRVAVSASVGFLEQEGAGWGGEDARLTPADLLRRSTPIPEDRARNLLHRFLFGREQLDTPVERLSHGERRRLALVRFMVEGRSLLLLDEPTNHLDLPARESFEAAFAGYGGAAVVVTHDRYFIERFADRVLTIEGGRLVAL